MVINTLSEYVAMSYDMSIGEEDFNYTYNVSKMWYAAIQILDALRYIRAMRGNARTARLCATKPRAWPLARQT